MKTFFFPFKALICCISFLCFMSSCDNDDVDTSLLVGVWDSRSILYYENDEWIDRSEFPGFLTLIFDGKDYMLGGPTINCIPLTLTYSFDSLGQIIYISDGSEIKVLRLTEVELEIEQTYKSEDINIIKRSIFERRDPE